MRRADYSDQVALFNPQTFGWPVHIIGVGSIGGALLPALAQLGIAEIHIWDNDRVERRNLTNQCIYRRSDLGLAKVEAAAAYMQRQETEATIITHCERVSAETRFDGVVMSGVDSMRSRKVIWEAVRASAASVPLYVDGRIGGVQLHMQALNPLDPDLTVIERYESWLFPDEQSAKEPCGGRTIGFTPLILAGLMTDRLVLFAREQLAVQKGDKARALLPSIFLDVDKMLCEKPRKSPHQGVQS